LFWLRWLFLAGVVLLVLLAEDTILGDQALVRDRLWIGTGVGAGGNLLLGILALSARVRDRTLAVFGVLLDSVLAVLFFWAYNGAEIPLLILGTLAVFMAAFRLRWRGIVPALVLVAGGAALVAWQLDQLHDAEAVNLGLSEAVIAAFGLLGLVLGTNRQTSGGSPLTLDEREVEAQRLRSARERARAIYEMANTLSATLDYRRVLEAAQAIGTLGLRDDMGPEARLISAVLLFQGEDNLLRVVTSRGLTRADEIVAISGQRGVVGLALKQAEPVFAGDAGRDPELRYFVAFQESKSVLAIPLRAGFDVYGVIIFGSDRPNAFSDEHVELMTAIGTQSTLSLQNAVLYQNLLNEKERIVEVEEDARKKLSRDLHDGPTQSVAAIAMRVNYIRRLIERQPQQAIEELWKVEELARRTTKEIRHMLFTLRPLVLETQGLIAAFGQLAEKMRDTHNTNVMLQGQPDVEKYLDTNAQGVLFYIVEEAVNNARKHAESNTIWVRLYRREAFVVAEIEDDGVGFDVGEVDSTYDQRGSLGMVNMRERAELIEGTLRIQSAVGRGTKISVLVPTHPAGGPDAVAGEAVAPPLDLQSRRAGTGTGTFALPEETPSRPRPPTRPKPPGPPKEESRPSRPRPLTRLAQSGTQAPTGSQPRKPSTGPLRPTPSISQPDKPVTGPLGATSKPSRPRKPGTGPIRPVRSPSQPSKPASSAPKAAPGDRSSDIRKPGAPRDSQPRKPDAKPPTRQRATAKPSPAKQPAETETSKPQPPEK